MSFHQINRFNHGKVLSEDDLRHFAPSIFATKAHESRSDRFVAIPTITMVRSLQAEGWEPVRANQSRTRDYTRRNFTKHMVRFRRADSQEATNLKVGDNLLELILVNGNDGSAAYKMDAGVFRIACLNGMVVKSADYGNISIRHTGAAKDHVVEASYEILDNADRAMDATIKWSQIHLNEPKRKHLAVEALIARYGSDDYARPLTTITADQVLTPRRYADDRRDLWTTFNVIQENLTQGGIHYRSFDALGQSRRMVSRQVRGIDQDVSLNKSLWGIAASLAEAA